MFPHHEIDVSRAGRTSASSGGSVSQQLSDGSSLARGLSVLQAITHYGHVRVNVIADELGIPVSTIYRYLRTLREFDLVEESDGEYTPGPALATAAVGGVTRNMLVELADPILEKLTLRTSETASLTVRIGSYAMCIHQRESPHYLRLAFTVGQVLPLYAGAGSRVLLAYAPVEILREVLARELQSYTDNTPDRDSLTRRLKSTRLSGIATSRGEFTPGSVAVAAPVFRADGIVCAVTVAGPGFRCTPAWQANTKQVLSDATAVLEGLLRE